MVTVVSDAGPLIHLSQIRKLPLLAQLFGVVLLTEKAKAEAFDNGIRLGYLDAEAVGTGLAEGWLRVEPFPISLIKSSVKLAQCENVSLSDAETLLLAVDKKAELLVDDKSLFYLAKMYRLKVWDTWTLLLEALKKDYLELNEIKSAIKELDNVKFSLNPRQAQEILEAANIIERHKKNH